jgi:glycine/D-amino acid oxidase-like deaminating enzyme
MKEVDFLIIGQGIAGTVFCHEALQAGFTCHVVDVPLEGRASAVAGGLINPITGRFMKKSWMIEQLIPALETTYKTLDSQLGIRSYRPMPIWRLLSNPEDINHWEVKRSEEGYNPFMGPLVQPDDPRLVPHPAAGLILNGAWLNTSLLLSAFRSHLLKNGMISEGVFNWNDINGNEWQHICFKYVVSCEGIFGRQHPLFPNLPLQTAKGQVMTIQLEGNDFEQVFNKNMLMIPLGKGCYKIGATMEHTDELSITDKGLSALHQKAKSVIAVTYQVLKQEMGLRPTVKDRRPLLGRSALHEYVYIFNGLGTKGVSLAPYFARHLLQHITQGASLMKEVDIQRFG